MITCPMKDRLFFFQIFYESVCFYVIVRKIIDVLNLFLHIFLQLVRIRLRAILVAHWEELEMNMKKEMAKAYGNYAKQFTPRPKYFSNSLKAFMTGGAICAAALAFQNYLQYKFGLDRQTSSTFVTMGLIATSQLLTGLGVFDVIAKFAGAGVIVPITGFANSMVAPAIEYKREGPVLGAGAKMFSVAGPVLVCGISSATVVGIIYYFM